MPDTTQDLHWTTDDGSPNVPVGWYSEAQFCPPAPRCPHPEYWHTHDAQSTEAEVIDMAVGLVRGLQPDVCLETGTSRGFMAARLGKALHVNGHGVLHTYEPHPATYEEAVGRCAGLDQVVLHNEPSMVPWDHGPIDFAWFDSLLELRWDEFDHYCQWMHDRTVVCFHDTAPRFGQWTTKVRKDRRLQSVEFPTPRGVIVARYVP